MRGNLDKSISVRAQGDIYTLWKPVNEILGSHNTKITITLDLHNRRARRISHGVFEVLVETRSTHIDWKLKLNGVSITREFKPTFLLELPDLNRYLCKFVYDITGLLNTDEATSREWANVTVKHDGGDPLVLRGIMLSAIYEDTEAFSTYNHVTGLLLLERDDEFTYNLNSLLQNTGDVQVKLVFYAPRAVRVRAVLGDKTETLTLQHNQVEEYTISSTFTPYIKLTPEVHENIQNYVVLSSVTVYSTSLRTPHLSIESIEASRQGSSIKIKLRIANNGESIPDRVIISVFNRGFLLGMVKCDPCKYEPNTLVEEELVIPAQSQLSELTVRIAWSKLTRTWFTDGKVVLA